MDVRGRLTRGQGIAAAALRVAVGSIFLWAGLEKAFGAGEKGWSAAGFLGNATGGTLGWPFVSGEAVAGTIYNPTHELWVGLAANTGLMSAVDFLVVFGQIAIGAALILGLATRFASMAGALMMLLFFVAAWDFEFGIVNQHLAYAVVTAFIGYIGAGRYFGLDGVIEEAGVVERTPALRYVLG